MSDIVLKVESISKQYRLGQLGTGTISHDINRAWAKIRGKEDPYLKVGDANDRSKAGGSDYVWSLKDINFEVKQGEVLGIIGKNGAGKSTLLKILSQVTTPTTGQVKVKGHIAALLEVGTGFHPDLSGRENIFLNGAILGMNKAEIKSKLDEIVDFSGVAKYIDTPVKRYSSGMMVRLGFSVAAHLEPEILIVDEVLAVGDSEFQKKCIGKMKDVSGQGRTVLFVSHNMAAVKELCDMSIVMQNGKVAFHGNVDNGIEFYKNNNNYTEVSYPLPIKRNELSLNSIKIENLNKNNLFTTSSELNLTIDFETYIEEVELVLRVDVWNESNVKVFREEINLFKNGKTETGKYSLKIRVPAPLLNYGNYFITVDFIDYKKRSILLVKEVLGFEILSSVSIENTSRRDINDSVIITNLQKEILLTK